MNDDKQRLRSYLDQENARILDQWDATETGRKLAFMDWLASDFSIEPTETVPAEWMQFATRCALAYLQKQIMDK